MPDSHDEYCAREVRDQDRDRWLTALFAPDSARPALLALYAFNNEIARTREAVTQPMIGQIRLQWWREAWEGIWQDRPRQHPVVLALHRHCRMLDRQMVMDLIGSRERDLDPAPMPDMNSLCGYAEATSATLMKLAVDILGGREPRSALDTQIGAAGTAYALIGLLRATSYFAASQRVYLPADRLAAHQLEPESVYQDGLGAGAISVIGEVAKKAASLLDRAGAEKIPRVVLPALLPARLGRFYLARLRRADFDPDAPAAKPSDTGRHLALVAAAITRRV